MDHTDLRRAVAPLGKRGEMQGGVGSGGPNHAVHTGRSGRLRIVLWLAAVASAISAVLDLRAGETLNAVVAALVGATWASIAVSPMGRGMSGARFVLVAALASLAFMFQMWRWLG